MSHVKGQNWFAVGLDVLVVIVGIFLGMQVTEWNEERKDVIEEGQYILRVKDDIEQMLLLQQAELKNKNRVINQLYFTLNVLKAGKLEDGQASAFEDGLISTGSGSAFISLRYQIPSLQDPKESALITNRDLRIKIRNHDEDMKKLETIEQTAINVATDLFIEVTKMFTWLATPPDVTVGTADVEAEYDFEKLLEDDTLYRRLSVFYANIKI